MSKLQVWQVISILLIGLILGYAGGRVELALTDGTNGETQVAAENPSVPTPEVQEPTVLSDEEQKLLIDADGSDYVLGDENATVTIVEFSDYQCPFCGKYSTETSPLVKTNFIDTGKVKYYFRDFPLEFHPQALPAAKAANCAGKQGKFWEMHDKIFASQNEWSGNEEAGKLFAAYAKELGLDTSKLETCISESATETEIANDLATGSILGASGTPSFFINGEKLVGAQPYAQFEAVINAALND